MGGTPDQKFRESLAMSTVVTGYFPKPSQLYIALWLTCTENFVQISEWV